MIIIVSLNLDKSSYFITNPMNIDHKVNLTLNGSYLKYKPILRYLGVFVYDKGDISLLTNEKRSN